MRASLLPESVFKAQITKRDYADNTIEGLEIEFIGEYETDSMLSSTFHFNDNAKKFLSLFPNKKFKRVHSDKSESRFFGEDGTTTSLVISETYEEEINATHA